MRVDELEIDPQLRHALQAKCPRVMEVSLFESGFVVRIDALTLAEVERLAEFVTKLRVTA